MTLLRDNLANTALLQRMEDRGLQPNVISYVLLPFTRDLLCAAGSMQCTGGWLSCGDDTDGPL